MLKMEPSTTRELYEAQIASLVGETFESVTYHEVDYFDDEYHFFDDPRFDSIDFGLGIKLGSGKEVSLTWGSEFYQYGVSLADELRSPRSQDVSTSQRWKNVMGKTLKSVDVSWSWVENYSKTHSRIYYPQDLLLNFGDDIRRVVSALEIREDNWCMGMMDNIIVFDDIEMAKHFKCLQ